MRGGSKTSKRNAETTHTRITWCLVILVFLVCVLLVAKHYNPEAPNMENDALGAALANTANEDNTLIIATVNRASVEEGDTPIFDVFIGSFWVGHDTRQLVDHLLVVAIDQSAYDRCQFLRLHCYRLPVAEDDKGKEMLYMSSDFIWMMWRRTKFLGDVLKRGYSFIFTDIDVLWLRNPYQVLSQNTSIDLQISTEKFNGDEWTPSRTNQMNAGFYMVRSNNKTISLFDMWYEKKDTSTGKHDQDVLNDMAWEGKFRELGLVVRLMDTIYFSGFCQESRDIRLVVTVHANCCRSITAKVADLKDVVAQWKIFRRNETSFYPTSALANMTHMACWMSWA
ncbi:Uncharacterized protein At1g28695 [Linum perenne]